MTQQVNFSLKTREENNFKVNKTMSKRLADTLNTVKGQVDYNLNQQGELNIDEFINFRIDKRGKNIPSLDIFDEEIETHGLNVFFVVDCSLSMLCARDQLRDITATIFSALKKCPFINFKVISFSGNHYEHKVMIQNIEKLDDVKFISPDFDDRLTPTDLALHYAHNEIVKTEGKKLVILFSDGLPEDMSLGYDELQTRTKAEVVKMKNSKINFFTVFFRNVEYAKRCRYNINDISEKMRELFKGALYESENFEEIEKVLQKKLIKAVEKINESD